MNLLTIVGGLAVIGLSALNGLLSIKLFIQGGMVPIFGGIALAVVALMTLALGVVLIGLGWAGFVARIRNGK